MNLHKLVAIVTDGAASMIGEWHELIVRFQKNVPQLMGVLYIAYREALATQNANK